MEKNAGADDDEDDDFDNAEAELTSSGCLEAIKRIFSAPLPEQVYAQLTDVFIPTFNYCLTVDGSDFLEEGLSCFNLLIYKP
jgi:hypothetical protein